MHREDGVDMKRLRKKWLSSVWIIFLPFMALSLAHLYAVRAERRWPGMLLLHVTDERHGKIAALTSTVATNLADLVSLVVFSRTYCNHSSKMWIYPMMDDKEQQLAPGNVSGDIPMENRNDVEPMHQDNSNNNNDNEAMPNHAVVSSVQHQVVARTLKMYTFLAVADVSMVASVLHMCYPVGHTASYLYQFVFSYWAPFYLIKSSFHEMDDF